MTCTPESHYFVWHCLFTSQQSRRWLGWYCLAQPPKISHSERRPCRSTMQHMCVVYVHYVALPYIIFIMRPRMFVRDCKHIYTIHIRSSRVIKDRVQTPALYVGVYRYIRYMRTCADWAMNDASAASRELVCNLNFVVRANVCCCLDLLVRLLRDARWIGKHQYAWVCARICVGGVRGNG